MTLAASQLHQGDCLELFKKLDAGSVNLVFADPPFNIGYEYDVYHDRKDDSEYLDWSKKWMRGVHRALTSDGTFWLAIGDEYAAELKWIATREIGFYCRSWVIWYYTFGVNCTRKFNRSHVHLFHFVKNPTEFTFNADDPSVRVPSARQLVYADGRANPRGRLPDDTWILRPQDLPEGFQPTDDTWYFPRVAGTFKERAGFHGCQMPERLLARIVLVSSKPGDCVLDPFSGSGSTLAVAKKLNRNGIGFELSKEYVRLVRTRLDGISVGDPLDGMADPLTSAPSTASRAGRIKRKNREELQLVAKRAVIRPKEATTDRLVTIKSRDIVASPKSMRLDGTQRIQHPTAEMRDAVVRAFLATHEGFAADPVLEDPILNAAFCDACRAEGIPGKAKDWNHLLLNVRKQKQLPRCTRRRARLDAKEIDGFVFASEIALQSLIDKYKCTLDDVLCDPDLGREFDEFARRLAPGYEAFHYRHGALSVRKRGLEKKRNVELLAQEDRDRRFSRVSDIDEITDRFRRKDRAGLYLLESIDSQVPLYVGETLSLAQRLSMHRSSPHDALRQCRVRSIAVDNWQAFKVRIRGANQAFQIDKHKPRFNYSGLDLKESIPV